MLCSCINQFLPLTLRSKDLTFEVLLSESWNPIEKLYGFLSTAPVVKTHFNFFPFHEMKNDLQYLDMLQMVGIQR